MKNENVNADDKIEGIFNMFVNKKNNAHEAVINNGNCTDDNLKVDEKKSEKKFNGSIASEKKKSNCVEEKKYPDEDEKLDNVEK